MTYYEEYKKQMDEIRKGLDELQKDTNALKKEVKTKRCSEYFADLSDGDIMLIISKDGFIRGFMV